MSRSENIEVFRDLMDFVENNGKTAASIQVSKRDQYTVSSDIKVSQPVQRYEEPASLIVSKKRSMEAASYYAGGFKTCVHNFASWTNPGGGVTKGSSAQEECLCRVSTLYPCLVDPKMAEEFYNPHKTALKTGKATTLYDDSCIFTPGVLVVNTDTAFPERMKEEDWYNVDVITCAAPNLRMAPNNVMNPEGGDNPSSVDDEQLYALHVQRMRRLLDLAVKEEEEVMILGAFGCGAFRNSPDVVAAAMKTVVNEYRYSFRVIEFAVYCSPWDSMNYDVFQTVLTQK